jgi:uncharacterized protein CbrC (UPF0167 family)
LGKKPPASQGFAQPHFRFFPGAYEFAEDGKVIFRRETGPCDACGMADINAYQGSIYCAQANKPVVCAQCIADGRLGRVLGDNAHFGLHDVEVETLDWRDPLVREAEQRTPGFATFNPFIWPVHDGVPMAFMGYGNEDRWKHVPEALAAMREANEGEDCFPAPYALIFKQLDGPVSRAVIDRD